MIPDALVPAKGRAVVLIDGGSGSGKTMLALELADAWPGPIQVVSLDAFYPGWDGLAAASALVATSVLDPRRPGYRRWDWEAGRPDGWVPVDPEVGLIVEGCGALTPRNRALATAGLWVVGDPEARRAAALERDGDVFAPHWERWAAQERAHWRANRPRELADYWVVGGRFMPGPGGRRPGTSSGLVHNGRQAQPGSCLRSSVR